MSEIDETAIIDWSKTEFPDRRSYTLIRKSFDECLELMVHAISLDIKNAQLAMNPTSEANPFLRTIREGIGEMGMILVQLAAMYDTTLAETLAEAFTKASGGLYEYNVKESRYEVGQTS